MCAKPPFGIRSRVADALAGERQKDRSAFILGSRSRPRVVSRAVQFPVLVSFSPAQSRPPARASTSSAAAVSAVGSPMAAIMRAASSGPALRSSHFPVPTSGRRLRDQTRQEARFIRSSTVGELTQTDVERTAEDITAAARARLDAAAPSCQGLSADPELQATHRQTAQIMAATARGCRRTAQGVAIPAEGLNRPSLGSRVHPAKLSAAARDHASSRCGPRPYASRRQAPECGPVVSISRASVPAWHLRHRLGWLPSHRERALSSAGEFKRR